MWRAVKLITNCFLSSIVFNYFIEILVLLLNPHLPINSKEFFILYFHLYIFYGPLWFIFIIIAFLGIQFFSEKNYPIGIYNPPTITYFLSFTILILSFIFYFNYDYYFEFFVGAPKFNFIRILLSNLALVITGIVFVFYKKIKKKYTQVLFLSLLVIHIFHSYTSVINSGRGQDLSLSQNQEEKISPQKLSGEFTPRKIRIVIMDGLSLNLIHSLTSEQKLLNFKEILNKGVYGRIKTFKPNLDLSMLHSALTGCKPSGFARHSHDRFKFTGLHQEFDVWPRYVFFRNSPSINTTSFFKRDNNVFLDNINRHYETHNLKTVQLVRPPHIDRYSERALRKNNRFVPLFSDLLKPGNGKDEKYKILKKFFFFDDYVKNMIPDLKDSNIYYSIIRLPGLGIIGKYFYQYHMPQIFGGIHDETKIKKYGWLIEKYYEYYDSIIGNLMSTTGDDELLVILSFFEYEPLPVWRRILVHLFGQRDVYVYKSLNSQGTILLYEKKAIKREYSLKTISIYDVYPTLIYYSGFQLSRDLQGEVLREIFTDDFLLNNPIDINIDYNRYP
ncbi:MAG: hypothetical protein JSV88_31285 [Candidatus Aminicenantes bacterium]|nr:MAG: hypothetical protein JSV88_31285 [Candidatus Aminicenantes bacterium]